MTGTTLNPALRKRAVVVCFRCHSKKIKCDLAHKPSSHTCSHCAQAQVPCQLRPSRRGLKKRSSAPLGRQLHFADQDTEYEPHGEIEVAADALASLGGDGLDALNMDVTLPQTPAATTTQSSTVHGPYETVPGLGVSGAPNPSTMVTRDTGFPMPSPSSSHNYSTPPGAASLRSRRMSVRASSFGQSGYMTILGGEEEVSDRSEEAQPKKRTRATDTISPVLQDAFADSYLKYCYTWCPVLDPELLRNHPTELPPLLQHCLALCGTRVNPPLVQFKEPMAYYKKCKEIFYNDNDCHPLLRIAAIMLFFWWSTGAPNQVNMDNAWWWTGIAIRAAQEYGLNREPKPSQITQPWDSPGLRRRIWWTLFVRDRILSISQGRPTVIDPDYTIVNMVTPADFPDPNQPHVRIFISWVELQAITGRISKHLSRRGANGMMPDDRIGTAQLLNELSTWVNSLPQDLRMPTRSAQAPKPSRDVHRLHLTYLANVILLHLTNSSQGLPKASKAAIIAASCIARLFEHFLIRGDIRFLTGDAGWEVSVALLALLHARRMRDIRALADADIHVLHTALQQLSLIWPSSRMFLSAFEKLFNLTNNASPTGGQAIPNQDERQVLATRQSGEMHETSEDMPDDADGTWMNLFPFVNEETSPLIGAVLSRNVAMSFPEIEWPFDMDGTLQDFLALPTDFTFDWAMV